MRASTLLKTWVAAQRINLLITQALSTSDAWTPHYALLSMIKIIQPVTPTELAKAMGFRPTTVSDYLQELHELGHIRRDPNPDDGRSYFVSATPAGDGAFERANRPMREVFALVQERLGRPLDEIDVAVDDLSRAVDAVLEELTRAEREAAPG
jgi:DNA-binding MarR family transcriptional regulator